MHQRRPSVVTSPDLLPSIPPSRTSSILSATSPRTPRSSPLVSSSLFLPSANRKSTGSWNSSNYGDDVEWEWKPEQLLFLTRTLEALPHHLLTPFHGPVPPSNLLDKVARGVLQAKGSEEWPHSVRATRLKLAELARNRDKDSTREAQRRKIITEEEEDDAEGEDYFAFGDVLQPKNNSLPRRPPYRESSMDFISTEKLDIKSNDSISRLSQRLQRVDRYLTHPYPRNTTRSPTPLKNALSSRALNVPASTPATPTTAVPTSMPAPRANLLRRSISSFLSSISNSSAMDADTPMPARDPSPQRVRRSESFCAPSQSTMTGGGNGRKQSFKRAPSFGIVAAAIRTQASADPNLTSTYPSSDEEEKVRSHHAKKTKRSSASTDTTETATAPSSPGSPMNISPVKAKRASSSSEPSSPTSATSTSSVKPARKVKANLKRNPSIFGPELPKPPVRQPIMPFASTKGPAQAPALSATTQTASASSAPKKLRRIRTTSLTYPAARRISFGSLEPPVEDVESAEFEAGLGALGGKGLGSAFQLN